MHECAFKLKIKLNHSINLQGLDTRCTFKRAPHKLNGFDHTGPFRDISQPSTRCITQVLDLTTAMSLDRGLRTIHFFVQGIA